MQSGSTQNRFCTCQIYRDHPSHIDANNTGASVCPLAPLNAYCYCGEIINAPHNYNILKYNANTHWYECACGKILSGSTSGHSLVYSNSNNITHEESCRVCGYVSEVEHTLDHCVSKNNSSHLGTCSCRYSGVEAHTLVPISLQYLACTKCSYTRDRLNGVNENVHLGVEEDEDTE